MKKAGLLISIILLSLTFAGIPIYDELDVVADDDVASSFTASNTFYPWPMFHHDLNRSGYSPSPAPNTNATLWVADMGWWTPTGFSPAVADGKVFIAAYTRVFALDENTGEQIWNFSEPDGLDYMPDFYSSPAFADSMVFVGGWEGWNDAACVYALNATSEELTWDKRLIWRRLIGEYTSDSFGYSSPAVVNGRVFIGPSREGRVVALNATTGQIIWTYNTDSLSERYSSPAVVDDMVFVAAPAQWSVIALNATTNDPDGQLLWRNEIGAMVLCSPAVAYNRVFIGTFPIGPEPAARNKTYALDMLNGQVIWNFTTGRIVSSPAVADGMVFIGSADNSTYALNATTNNPNGELIWNYETGGAVYSSPAVADGKVFIGSHDNRIYALDEFEGNMIWSYNFGRAVEMRSPAVANGMVFMASGGDIYAFGSVWPMFRHDLRHTGYSTSPAPNTNDTLWIYQIGPYGWWAPSSPAVVNGIVFIGSRDDRVYALNAADGRQVWNYTIGHYGVFSSPTVVDGIVFIGSTDGNVYALNATNGEQIWNRIIGVDVLSSPAVAYGRVFIASHAQDPQYTHGNVYALNQSTGAILWNYTTGDLVHSSPAVADGMVFVASGDGWIYALNATTSDQNGELLWRYWIQPSESSPAVVDGLVFVGSGDKVYALNATNGQEIWTYDIGGLGEFLSSPAVAYGRVFIGSTELDGSVCALNATTDNQSGELIWRYTTGDVVYSSPAVADGKVFVGSGNTIYALNATTDNLNGELIWSYETGGAVDSSPAVADGMVFIGSDDGNVYAFGGIYPVPARGYFIIVAGQLYVGDLRQDYINYGCNEVFRILREKGFSGDRIYYMNQPAYYPQDVDGDGQNDIDALSSNANLQWAIENWASKRVGSTEPLFLYLFDHGGQEVFCITEGETTIDDNLASWLDTLENATNAPIHVIYAACHSGSFIYELSKDGRVIISSCEWDQLSYVFEEWELFSVPFWRQIQSGHSVGWSFNRACDVAEKIHGDDQTPLLDDDGNGTGNTGPLPNGGDGYLALALHIGHSRWVYPWTSYVIPKLYHTWPPPPNVTLWAKVENKTTLLHVRAMMIPPDWSPPPPDTVLLDPGFEYFEMVDPDHDGNFTVSIPAVNFTNHATGPSDFKFIVTAKEENNMTAIPLVTGVGFTETGEPPPDGTPPRVHIEGPIDMQTVQGTISINGTATDDVCLQKVQLYVDEDFVNEINVQPTSNSFFEFDFDTATVPSGNRTILMRAFDTSGNNGTQTLTIIVPPIRDIAVTDVTASKQVVGQGYFVFLNVTVENQGDCAETFRVTAYANTTLIDAFTNVTLSSKSSVTITFTWNTTGMVLGNYTISATATLVPATLVPIERDRTDNTYIDGTVFVTIKGDVNGDGAVDAPDLIDLNKAYGSDSSKTNWNPNCDFNDDDKVDALDLFDLSKNYGKTM